MTTAQQQYDALVNSIQPKRPILTNCIRAFLVGGTICTIGQGLQWVFINYFNFNEKTSVGPTYIVLIFLQLYLLVLEFMIILVNGLDVELLFLLQALLIL